jgi:hypothetical protein
LLGFSEHDIAILVGHGHLKPLGTPAKNAPKFFAAEKEETKVRLKDAAVLQPPIATARSDTWV